jgi:hypothetical protein
MARRPPPPTGGPGRPARSTGKTAARAGSRVGSRAADEGQRVASHAAGEAQEVASTAQEKGQEVAGVATRQAREIGATAKEQADRVRGEVVEQGGTVVAEARSQLESQAHDQSRRLADTLARLGDEVRALSQGQPEDAATLTPYLSNAAEAVYDAADRLYSLAGDIDERGMGSVLQDVQEFARRRPGAFLVGAALAGFGLGRAIRASSSGEEPPPSGGRAR